MKTILYIFLLLVAGCGSATAQDLHFSQYFNNPLLVNPANAGFNPDYDYRVGGSYRNQWANLIANPYKTMTLWGDAQLFTERIADGWVGIGGALYKDQAGSASLTSLKGYGAIAYHQMIADASLLSLGFSGGIVNKRIDNTKLVFDGQWSDIGQGFGNSGGETLATNNVNYFDLNVGLNYAWFISDIAYLNIGVSALHINQPSEKFFSANVEDQKVPPRYTVFVNGNYKINDLWILNPNMYISKSAGSSELVLGMNANRDLSGDGTQQLILGLYYRNKDAIVPMLGYQVNDLKMTINYDVTTSALGNYNGRQGGYEISIVKSGVYTKSHRDMKCTSVKF
ncbi:PorP/SprF family type IX secretion system membrane protein [Parasediminibacterium sp. JCM 36343]|uniref:PorP/SprF family type IX secretion system membrane protein n=1 Tax=Parasediminibacterium sp. JCM 36343 TaxID=3374279 RepID=UPI00397D9293